MIEIFIFWVVSIIVAFVACKISIHLEERFGDGDMLMFLEDIWIVYIIILLIPFLNLIIAFVTMLASIFMIAINFTLITDGEEILRKIFFIKEK